MSRRRRAHRILMEEANPDKERKEGIPRRIKGEIGTAWGLVPVEMAVTNVK